ncbi:putative endonuclease [Microbacteriaceae bacterium SG_E_30_P1]|uniref:Endonuclease n=1 Tax=Antiquaquibacter oligotrophicus TaxID=2880260 RepID=A0ABT6KJT2_9MICO|nr:GIY-YIG nuclease family protein [Antiquaquibacter oligotrophicus]MDH6180064.1 putative endonuclease [Antiquaquibacter oligotrophicus]UDF14184.1 GIY-YIG nuclease family protein [Antiquaquibacter oligotrophicus]
MANTLLVAFMYILRCADGSYYVGSTRNLDHRMQQHSLGAVEGYTSRRLPAELVVVEEYEKIGDAYAREKQVQGWGRAKREALIASHYDDLPRLSRRPPR